MATIDAETEAGVLAAARTYAHSVHADDASGHDWWHVERVWRLARRLAREEQADSFVCELAALLHDVADEKLHADPRAEEQRLKKWIAGQRIPEETRAHVLEIIATMSFKGGGGSAMRTLEGAIVRDADRLDALGAIGIARTFAYSGAKGQAIYDPVIKPRESMTREQYRKERSTALNHFYEKLFKLKEGLVTATARRLGEEREAYMREFVERFLIEWTGGEE